MAALATAACTVVPVQPIPDPLPETLEWARPGGPEGSGGPEGEAEAGAFLGLEVRENDTGSLEDLAFEPGVRVTRVVSHSPADRAGFAIGDVLLAFGEVPVNDPSTLEALLRDPAARGGGTEVELEVRRGDSVFRVPVALETRGIGPVGEARLVWRADPARSRAGWLAGRGGVVLVTSDPEGPFPRAGLGVGTVVTALDGEPMRSERALIRSFQDREPGARVEVTWRSPEEVDGEATHTTRLHLYEPPRRVIDASLPVLVGYHASVDGDEAGFYLIDLWFISLFRYRREGNERHWRILRFISFSSGVGELGE